MNCIEVKNVTKRFKDVTALNNVSLKFEGEKIYGLLGRNGAGKSTLLNVITNRIFADEGEVVVNGELEVENDSAQRNIYLMSEKSYYPEAMKVKDVFRWSQEFYPLFDMESAMELADKFGLNVGKKVKELSTGYSSIFKIAVALSVNTPFVLLDEPVLGLDANHRDMFYKLLIEKYNDNPMTLVISTHLIEEVANIIEGIVIIKSGEILKNESCDEILSQGYTVTGSVSAIDDFVRGKEVIGYDTLGGLKTAYVMGHIAREDVPYGIEVTKLDLQKLFIQLTN